MVSTAASPREQNIFGHVGARNFSQAEIKPPENELIVPDTQKLEKMISDYNLLNVSKINPALLMPKKAITPFKMKIYDLKADKGLQNY